MTKKELVEKIINSEYIINEEKNGVTYLSSDFVALLEEKGAYKSKDKSKDGLFYVGYEMATIFYCFHKQSKIVLEDNYQVGSEERKMLRHIPDREYRAAEGSLKIPKGFGSDYQVYLTTGIGEGPFVSGFIALIEAYEKKVGKVGEILTEEQKAFLRTPSKKGKELSEGRKEVSASERMISVLRERNRIFFGAPGTGKSYQLNQEVKEILGIGDAEALNHSENVERVTFYPSYSYQQFVGTYKPWMESKKSPDEEETPSTETTEEETLSRKQITYKFVEGPLLRLLKKALETADQPFILVVEELNRAEAAAVFGDFFQLLDRDEDGKSEYGISVSEEVRAYLDDPKGKFPAGKKLYFPENFYIWATMNNADQGVNPLDTAFKRRWAFEYIGIDDGVKGLKGKVGTFWNGLRTKLNDALRDKLHLNEDKLMGPWFMKVRKDMNEAAFWNQFMNKVLLYLYEDAARLRRDNLFKKRGASYSSLCDVLKKAFGSWGECKNALEEIFEIKFDDIITDKDYPWSSSHSDEPTPESNSDTEDSHSAVKDAESEDNA